MNTALVQGLASYASWANRELWEHVQQVPPEALPVDRGLSFTSILGTLNHILVADRIWLARFRDEPSPGLALDQILYAEPLDYWQARQADDAAAEAFFSTVDADWLDGSITYGRAGSPDVRTRSRWALVLHLVNHGTYHRGQVAAVMNQLGYWPPETDFPAAPYFAGQPEAVLVPR